MTDKITWNGHEEQGQYIDPEKVGRRAFIKTIIASAFIGAGLGKGAAVWANSDAEARKQGWVEEELRKAGAAFDRDAKKQKALGQEPKGFNLEEARAEYVQAITPEEVAKAETRDETMQHANNIGMPAGGAGFGTLLGIGFGGLNGINAECKADIHNNNVAQEESRARFQERQTRPYEPSYGDCNCDQTAQEENQK